MQLIPLKSHLLKPEENLIEALKKALSQKKEKLKNGDIIAIASKAVAYSQGRLVSVGNKESFRALVKKEADKVLEDGEMVITLKNNILIPNAGIDNSNTPKGFSVLWPEEPFKSARLIRQDLIKGTNLKKFGVLITDSHCQPLRLGTSGIAIGWAGFEGVLDERGKRDLFGKKMEYTRMAIADNLASAANLLMGETNAAIPFVIIRGFDAEWNNKKASAEDYFISPKDCIYKNFYKDSLKA